VTFGGFLIWSLALGFLLYRVVDGARRKLVSTTFLLLSHSVSRLYPGTQEVAKCPKTTFFNRGRVGFQGIWRNVRS
jgi:hypothetical protein